MILKNNNSLIQIENMIGFLFGLGIFLLSMPYFMWGTDILKTFINLLLFIISLFYLRKLNNYDYLVLPLFLFYIIYSANGSNILGYISKLFIFGFLFIKDDKFLFFLNWFKKIFIFSLILSLVTYILVVFSPFQIDYNLIKPLNNEFSNYLQYPFLVSPTHLGFKFLNIRFNGMFDEPGVVGSAAVVLLFADKFNLKSKQNLIIFIAGLLSFSFYFIICSTFYFFYIANSKLRILIALLFFLIYFMTSNNPYIKSIVWDRVTIENGEIKGDNRSSKILDARYEQFINSENILWGIGYKDALKDVEETSSFKLYVIAYGIAFMFFVFFAFSLYAYFNINNLKYFFGYMFLLIGMFYQRPGFILDPPRFFLFIACIYSLKTIVTKRRTTIQKT